MSLRAALSRCLLPLLLAPAAALSAPGAPGSAPAADNPHAGDVTRCLRLRESDPRTAAALAGSLLSRPDLDLESELKALSCLGFASNLLGEPAGAVRAAERMEQQAKAHPSLAPGLRLRAHSQAGSIHHSAGQIHRAEAAYLRAYELSRELDAEEAALTQAATLNNIGLIHSDYLDSPDVADGYFRRALAAAETIGRENPNILHNLAANLVKLDRDAEALEAVRRGEAAARSQDVPLALGRLLAEHAAILARQGQHERARHLLQQALDLQRALPDPAGEAGTLAKLSTLQRRTGHLDMALATARRAWALVEKMPQVQKQREALQAWMAAHAALGQAEAAMAVGRRLHRLEVAGLKQQRLDLLADLQARTRTAVAQRELERLRHQAQIRAMNDERTRLLRRAGVALLVLLMLAGASFGLLQRRRNRQLREASATDPLTGLRNRRAATHALQALSAQRPAPGTRHVLFLIDIDHFKKVNDSFGHHAGDAVLTELAQRLAETSQPGDVVARWGGEEFLVACPDLTAAQACSVAARLQHALGGRRELAPRREWMLTVSLGFAPFPFFEDAMENWDGAIRLADHALYAAKDQRDAWAGLWGTTLPPGATPATVLDDPARAIRSGAIDLMASYAMERLPERPAEAA